MDEQRDRTATGTPAARPRVVVGVDGSPGARAALVHAWIAAARRGGGLDVVSVEPSLQEWSNWLSDVPPDPAAEARAVARIRGFVDDVAGDPAVTGTAGAASVPVRVRVLAGPVAPLLVDAAADADLLVMGSRGRGTVRSAVLGSVALRCTASASCPVVVVHEPPSAAASGVVVGVDGSASARAALRTAVDEAALTGSPVRVVAAFDLAAFWSDAYAVAGPAPDEIRAALRTSVEAAVAEVEEDAERLGPRRPVVTTEVVEGPASDVLLSRAEGAELLVVGGRGHGPVRGLLLGSVALRCVVHARCPVLVVRPSPGPAATPAGKGEQVAAQS